MITRLKAPSGASREPPAQRRCSSELMRLHRPLWVIAAEIQVGGLQQSSEFARAMPCSSVVSATLPELSASTFRKSCCISAREVPRGKVDATSSHCSAVSSRSPGRRNSAKASDNAKPAASSLLRSLPKIKAQPCAERDMRPAFVPCKAELEVQVKNVFSKLISTLPRVPPRVPPRVAPSGSDGPATPGRGGIPGGAGAADMPGSGGIPGGAGGLGGPGGPGGADDGGATGAPKVSRNSP
mmetsp:Transcript_41476/g.98838  ORF Transcript_41476/g.98838 Transcript_41476/m.98838 type:complete len:240 (-) Transcript_41476:519-1238(-)